MRRVRAVTGLLVLLPLVGCGGGCGCSGRQHPVFDAAREGDLVKVRMLLDADGSVMTARERVPPRGRSPFPTYTGWSILHCAAEGGHVPVIDLLLDRGADVNFANDAAGGQRPLHLAAAGGHAAAVAKLLDRGADLTARGASGVTALHAAAGGHRAAVVRLLLERGAEANSRTGAGATPLHLAAGDAGTREQFDNPGRADRARDAARDTAAALIDRGADVNARDVNGATPLVRCCEAANPYAGQVEIAGLLLARGATVNDSGGPAKWTPLHWAARVGGQPEQREVALVKLLLERGADATARDAEGRTPLDLAPSPPVQELLRRPRG